MAFSLNRIMLIGNLGSDAEHRFTTNNVSVTSFSIATTNSYKGKDGNWVNETTWHDVVAFGLSDFFKDSLKKGTKWYVEGRITKEEYTDKDGIKRYPVKIIADKYNGLIPLGDSKPDSHITNNESKPEPATDEPDGDLPF